MKKLIVAFLLIGAGMGACTVQAQGMRHHHGGYYGGGWIAPALIGGVIGYELSRPRYEPPPVVYTPAPVVIQPQPYLYAPPVGFHWEQILDAHCNCYRLVLVQG
jgi:hypothetical protein